MSDKTLLAANIRQAARIEELEKELASLRRYKNLYAANARIAELEAALTKIANDEEGDYDYLVYIARAALSGEGVT